MTVREHTELLVATTNAGKVRELTGLLRTLPLRLRGLSDFPRLRTVEETGATFAENATLKAVQYGARTGLLTLADDSGLEVDALGGAPGVLSARYAGESASDAERVALLLGELARAGAGDRRARFVCAVALYDPRASKAELFNGTSEGQIAAEPRGAHGYGYDPVYVPEGFTQTFAELPPDVKQRISHRALALRLARNFLLRALSGDDA